MAGVLSDLSGIFCMFGFYLIMFNSQSLLCALCSAPVSTTAVQKIKNHFTERPNGTSIRHDFPLIPFPSPCSVKLQGSDMR